MKFKIVPIFRENKPNAFGLWIGNPRTVFGIKPDGIFETYEDAYRFAITREKS